MAHEYVLYVTFVASKIVLRHPNRDASKNVSTPTISEFFVLTRFHETVPTVQSVSSSEIQRINSIFLTEITILPFFKEFGIYRVLHSPLLKRNFVLKFWRIITQHMHMQRASIALSLASRSCVAKLDHG